VGVVGAEEGCVLAILLDPCRRLFKDELLGSGHAYVARGVGGRLKGKLHAEILAGLLHDRAAASERLVAHVAREGDVYEGLASELLRGIDDEVSA